MRWRRCVCGRVREVLRWPVGNSICIYIYIYLWKIYIFCKLIFSHYICLIILKQITIRMIPLWKHLRRGNSPFALLFKSKKPATIKLQVFLITGKIHIGFFNCNFRCNPLNIWPLTAGLLLSIGQRYNSESKSQRIELTNTFCFSCYQ